MIQSISTKFPSASEGDKKVAMELHFQWSDIQALANMRLGLRHVTGKALWDKESEEGGYGCSLSLTPAYCSYQIHKDASDTPDSDWVAKTDQSDHADFAAAMEAGVDDFINSSIAWDFNNQLTPITLGKDKVQKVADLASVCYFSIVQYPPGSRLPKDQDYWGKGLGRYPDSVIKATNINKLPLEENPLKLSSSDKEVIITRELSDVYSKSLISYYRTALISTLRNHLFVQASKITTLTVQQKVAEKIGPAIAHLESDRKEADELHFQWSDVQVLAKVNLGLRHVTGKQLWNKEAQEGANGDSLSLNLAEASFQVHKDNQNWLDKTNQPTLVKAVEEGVDEFIRRSLVHDLAHEVSLIDVTVDKLQKFADLTDTCFFSIVQYPKLEKPVDLSLWGRGLGRFPKYPLAAANIVKLPLKDNPLKLSDANKQERLTAQIVESQFNSLIAYYRTALISTLRSHQFVSLVSF